MAASGCGHSFSATSTRLGTRALLGTGAQLPGDPLNGKCSGAFPALTAPKSQKATTLPGTVAVEAGVVRQQGVRVRHNGPGVPKYQKALCAKCELMYTLRTTAISGTLGPWAFSFLRAVSSSGTGRVRERSCHRALRFADLSLPKDFRFEHSLALRSSTRREGRGCREPGSDAFQGPQSQSAADIYC